MAKFLWERCDEAIPSAIIASRIYLKLSDMIAKYDSDTRAMYLQNKQYVTVSLSTQDSLTQQRQVEIWGNIFGARAATVPFSSSCHGPPPPHPSLLTPNELFVKTAVLTLVAQIRSWE